MIRYLLGVDPSSTATGVVVLALHGAPAAQEADHLPWRPGPADVAVRRRVTIRPPSSATALGPRCAHIYRELVKISVWPEIAHTVSVVIEDPTDFGQREARAGSSQGKVGAAFGAAYLALDQVVVMYAQPGTLVHAIGSQRWLPRARNRRGGIHPMKHEDARRWLRMRWPALEACTDDETFAAGVALFTLTQHPMTVAA